MGTMFNLYSQSSEEFVGETFKPKSQQQNSIYRDSSGSRRGANKDEAGTVVRYVRVLVSDVVLIENGEILTANLFLSSQGSF